MQTVLGGATVEDLPEQRHHCWQHHQPFVARVAYHAFKATENSNNPRKNKFLSSQVRKCMDSNRQRGKKKKRETFSVYDDYHKTEIWSVNKGTDWWRGVVQSIPLLQTCLETLTHWFIFWDLSAQFGPIIRNLISFCVRLFNYMMLALAVSNISDISQYALYNCFTVCYTSHENRFLVRIVNCWLPFILVFMYVLSVIC